MHPRALPLCVLLQTRALPADAERIVDGVAFDAHDAPAGWAADRNCIRTEPVADVLRPDDVLNRASSDLSEPAAVRTGDHESCVAACGAYASPTEAHDHVLSRQPPVRISGTSTLCTQIESVQPQDVAAPLQCAGATSPTSSNVAT
jgi:hypothetical protein